ncbi:MAG: DNA translocase FtsK [Litorilinea sp.]|nr:MAG: DNA translocase FtsK [Litorilinea sp.]
MAKRRRSRRSKPQPSLLQQLRESLLRAEVIGLSLVLISVFTLLSLLTGSRGQLTGWWIDSLTILVGVGVWGVPLVTGALGLWMVIRAIERMPDLPWQRPAGCALLFFAYITGAALWSRLEPTAGGWLGNLLATGLSRALGPWGAWAVTSFLAVSGLILLTDRRLIDLAERIWSWLDGQWHARPGLGGPVPIQPSLPIPSGQVPWWKRLRERLPFWEPQPPAPAPANLVRPEGRSGPPPAEAPAAPAPRPAPPVTPSREAEILTPHIVGGQEWQLPKLSEMLLDWDRQVDSDDLIRRQGRLIQETLALFGVPADFEGAYKGPSVTQYLIKPGYIERTVKGEVKRVKVKVSKIAALANDLALALAAPSVRIEAPIPGTNYVGVEVPNQESNVVGLKELMESEAFKQMEGKLRIALGEDVKGQPIVADLARMPHLLIAGATGTGKSVCINAIITCLLLTHTPDTLRFLMVDPKMVELSVYNGIPHLLSPVVTEVDKAAGVLFWAVKEMERRYQLFSKVNARDLERYNSYLLKRQEPTLPYIVVVVDEMADLMMAAPEEVEKHICRLAQMARAVGIHLIIATQRPSVDVITGLIKANFPARIAFAVSSQIDSRVILDMPGAERLLGRGDMLFMRADASRLERLQGTWLSDEEINRVVRYWKGARTLEDAGLASRPTPQMAVQPPELAPEPDVGLPTQPAQTTTGLAQPPLFQEIEQLRAAEARDELFDDAVEIVREAGRGSVSLLQRKLRIGYSRASRLVDQLEEAGILGPDQGGSQGRPCLLGPTSSADRSAPPTGGRGRPESPSPQHTPKDESDPDVPRIWM